MHNSMHKEKAHSLEWADSYLIWTYFIGGDGGESNSPSRREPKQTSTGLSSLIIYLSC